MKVGPTENAGNYKTTMMETSNMLEAIFYIAIGAFVGWNLPQPAWAKSLQSKAVDILRQKGILK